MSLLYHYNVLIVGKLIIIPQKRPVIQGRSAARGRVTQVYATTFHNVDNRKTRFWKNTFGLGIAEQLTAVF